MLRALLAISLPLAASCTQVPFADHDRAYGRPALVRVGTIGDWPPVAETLVVHVHRDGAIRTGDHEISFCDLRRLLKARSREAGSHTVGFAKASNVHVLLRADGRLPWQAAQWLMTICAEAKVYRLFWAVLPEKGEKEGALALYLPTDKGGHFEYQDPAYERSVELSLNGPSVAPAVLHGAVCERLHSVSGASSTVVVLSAAPFASLGHVLQAADACFRAGISRMAFRTCTEYLNPQANLKRLVAKAFATGMDPDCMPGIRLDGLALNCEPAPMPPVARVRGGYAGNAPLGGWEWADSEEELEEEPEPEIPDWLR